MCTEGGDIMQIAKGISRYIAINIVCKLTEHREKGGKMTEAGNSEKEHAEVKVDDIMNSQIKTTYYYGNGNESICAFLLKTDAKTVLKRKVIQK